MRTRLLPRLLTGAGILGLLLVLLVGLLPGGQDDRLQEAADLGQFRAGDIISDAMFFDGRAMSADQVQAFLDVKGAGCVDGEMPCLRRYTETTPNMAADAKCNGYVGAQNETVASIVTRVGQSCGISQRVLLVLLQKEQGLVTGTTPTLRRYQAATGAGCPDTAPCDPTLAGFFNQVYNAAWKFKRYAASPLNYFPGRWNTILYNTSSSCGSSSVFILNQATAGLYTYTPYQPNQAALRAGYGTGDGCSAYGNRNFFSYFTDWFGSTHEPGAAAISDLYYRVGPNSIGAPTGSPVCGLVQGGCLQVFEQASIYWSPGSGAHVMRGGIRAVWGDSGWEWGILGYPVGEEIVTADGVGRLQHFQGGVIAWSPSTGAQVVRGGMLGAWLATGADTGVFGFPTTGELGTAGGAGRVQRFQGGSIVWSEASGAQPIRGAMFGTWAALGSESGVLGYPTSTELASADGAGRMQRFQGGTVYWSETTGAQAVRGGVLAAYTRSGTSAGDLGFPVGPEGLTVDGASVAQEFQGGTVYWSAATEGRAVLDGFVDAFESRGGVTGYLGLPVAEQRRLPSGETAQEFQRGVLYRLSSGEFVDLHGGVLNAFRRSGGETGPLGLPVADEETVGSAQAQRFQSGSIYWTASGGAHPVRGGVGGAWLATGGLTGPLGAPTTDELDARPGRSQAFVGGTIYWSEATGGRAVSATLRDAYATAGGPGGPLGFPAAAEETVGSAKVQRFQSGSIYWTSGGGAHPVRGGIGGAWLAAGGLTGALGAPTSDEAALGSGAVQRFTGGALYWASTAVARRMGTDVLDAWISAGGPTGQLGEPTGNQYVRDGLQRVDFEHGAIVIRNGAPEIDAG